VAFRKSVGAATPQLALAACSNEVLKTVFFEFMHTAQDGGEEVLFTIKLANATVCAHRIFVPDVKGAGVADPLSEEVELAFQRIEWEHRAAHTMSFDDWGR
jgi:type VI secretion system Hcp family effector